MPISYDGGKFQQPQPRPKVLAATAASSTETTVYSVPKGTAATEITFLCAYNSAGSATDLDVLVQDPAGSTYQVYRSASIAASTCAYALTPDTTGTLFLGAGWSLRAEASQDTSVSLVVSGIEYAIPVGGATL